MGMFIGSVVEDRLRYEQTGERPETRLIPHKRIKLDIMVTAYESDLAAAIANALADASMSEEQRAAEIKRIRQDVTGLLYSLRREPTANIDALFERMKAERRDL